MSAALQRKVAKLLSSKGRFSSDEVVECAMGLSEVIAEGDNNRESRRRLRSTLERRSVHIHSSLVTSFQAVDAQLTTLASSLTSLLTQCERTLAQLSSVKQSNALLVNATSQLQADAAELVRKEELVRAFLATFQLSEEDARALDEGEVNAAFFQALSRIGGIRERCQQLLLNSHQRIGLDILDGLGKRLEKGYERLYRFVQREAATLTTLPAPDSPFIPALTLLRSMPVYYDHCLNEMSQAHRLQLIQRFSQAMTRGEGGQRPLDLHAHDPVRYVKEMCSWTHQQVANERDFLQQLRALLDHQQQAFTHQLAGQPPHSQSPGLPPPSNDSSPSSTSSLLSAVFEGLSRQLRSRVDQALQSAPTAETAFRLWNVLAFYSHQMGPLFPAEATFRVTLHNLADNARASFFDVMRRQGEKLHAQPPQPPHDLSPPPVLTEGLSQLTAILAIAASSSLAPSSSMELAPVLAAALDPLLSSIHSAASSLPTDEQAVYAINNLDAALRALKRFEGARGRTEVLSLQLEGEVERLVQSQFDRAMEKAGLKDVVTQMQEQLRRDKEGGAGAGGDGARKPRLCEVKGLDEGRVLAALRSFHAALFSIGSFLVPQADRLLQSALRRSCREAVALSISRAYRELHAELSREDSGYSAEVRSVLQHTPEQIDLVLEVSRQRAPLQRGSSVAPTQAALVSQLLSDVPAVPASATKEGKERDSAGAPRPPAAVVAASAGAEDPAPVSIPVPPSAVQ